MAEADTVKEHDFVELEYTGKLADGTIFDTTSAEVAKKNNFHREETRFENALVCIGEQQVLAGLEQALKGKEIGKAYTMNLTPEQAFGKRDIKKVKILPAAAFREHKMDPHPGMQIDVDGQMGVVTSVSGGRVIVNFNHPLAGKEVQYEFTIKRKITDTAEQIEAYIHSSLHVPLGQLHAEVKEGKATVSMPLVLPEPIIQALGKRLQEIIPVVKEVSFVKKDEKK